MVFGGNDLIRGVVSLEGDNVVVIYNLSASEICPNKRGDLIRGDYCIGYLYTVKPAQEVTSIKQSPVFKGHPFPVPSYNFSYKSNLF